MADNHIPQPIMLDDTKPTQQQLREACEIALRIWQLQPWDMPMGENQLLVVVYANGRRCVLSVLGEYGEHRALTVYPDVASYARIAAIPPGDSIRVQDAFYSIHQRQIAFLKASGQTKSERAAFKASGVKFPRGVNPSLMSYIPGYAPEMMGAKELEATIEDANTFLNFMESHSAEDIAIYRGKGSLVSAWREAADGTWSLEQDEFSPLFPVAVNLSTELLEKVAALPVNDEFDLEIGAIPVPCDRTPSGRGIMARLMLAVEGATQFAMGTELISPPSGREFDWTGPAEFVLQTILKFGHKPASIAVLGESLKGVIAGLCAAELKGVEFLPQSECDAVRETFEFMASRMGL